LKPADDSTIDYKALVQQGYDRCVPPTGKLVLTSLDPSWRFLPGNLRMVLPYSTSVAVPESHTLVLWHSSSMSLA